MKSAERILYVGEFTGFAGGIERYAWQTARLLRAAGMCVDYLGTEPARDETLFRSGFRKVLSSSVPADGNYGLVVLHKLCSLPLLRRLRAMYGEKLVFLAHDHDLYCMRRHYYTPFGRRNCSRAFALPRCMLCALLSKPSNWKRSASESARLLSELRGHPAVVISSFMRDNLLRNGFAPEQVRVIPPAAEDAVPHGPFMPDGKLRLLFLGQLIRGKGCGLLLEAAAKLDIPFLLTVAGDGADRARLERQCARLGLTEKVRFAGWQPAPEKLFAQTDLLVFPSRWQEPFGLSGLEAQAHGIPAVAFRIGGVGEWLEDGVTGMSVAGMDVAGFAEAIECFARNPELLKTMGAHSYHNAVHKFTPERFVAAVRSLMEELQ